LRIIAGTWRGRRFKLPAGTQVRPTPDRVRETLFNWIGPRIVQARCLDLYAGSGILGLEALSRGAADVQFVDADRRLTAALAAQLERLESEAGVATLRAEQFLQRPAGEPYDIVFLDPPYDLPLEPVLEALWPSTHEDSLIYMERRADQGLPSCDALQWRKQSRAGAVSFGLASRTPGP
jgi:16S rRNA (guanine966-N2)-methyltransferase